MNDETLAQKLIHMTQEVRDLKTAHKRGLGTTRFYKYELEIYVAQGEFYQFIARIDPDEPPNAIIIPEMRVDEPAYGVILSFGTISSTTAWITAFSGWQIQDHTRMKITAISSSKLSEFRQA